VVSPTASGDLTWAISHTLTHSAHSHTPTHPHPPTHTHTHAPHTHSLLSGRQAMPKWRVPIRHHPFVARCAVWEGWAWDNEGWRLRNENYYTHALILLVRTNRAVIFIARKRKKNRFPRIRLTWNNEGWRLGVAPHSGLRRYS
jgi:hypothetical protein